MNILRCVLFILESTNNLLETASLCVNIQALALAQLTLEPVTFSDVAWDFDVSDEISKPFEVTPIL